MTSLFRNLRLTYRAVADNLAEDPFQFFLQASRRVPAGIVIPCARLVLAVAPAGSTAITVLFAEFLSGNQGGLNRRLELALERKKSPQVTLRLAEIALAANETSYADKFLALSSAAKGHSAASARRRWYAGAVTEAVDALEQPAGAASRRKGQSERLRSEEALLRGWSPQVAPVPVNPVPNRVLHLLTNSLPHTRSGYAQRSHAILLAQQAAGWETIAVTRLGYPVTVGKMGARQLDEIDGVQYRRLLPPVLAATQTDRLQQQAAETLRIAAEFRPSVIHTTTHFVNGLVARAVAEALDVPWVYEVRGQLADTWASSRGPEAKESERYKLFQEREAELMQSADVVITLGQAMKDNIVAAGVPERKILIAPNAVGGEYLLEPRTAGEARALLGLDPDAQMIGTVSSLVPYEGLDDLISAFKLLAPANPKLQLLIVGSGVSLPSLQEQARRSGFGHRIVFTGLVPADRARAYHQALDIFVVPRKNLDVTRSVTPLKPVEAMASARPVVASALPALSEIVEDGRTGLLTAPGDPAALAAILDSLLADAARRKVMGDNGRRRVLATRTWAANAVATVASYRAIAGDKTRSSN